MIGKLREASSAHWAWVVSLVLHLLLAPAIVILPAVLVSPAPPTTTDPRPTRVVFVGRPPATKPAAVTTGSPGPPTPPTPSSAAHEGPTPVLLDAERVKLLVEASADEWRESLSRWDAALAVGTSLSVGLERQFELDGRPTTRPRSSRDSTVVTIHEPTLRADYGVHTSEVLFGLFPPGYYLALEDAIRPEVLRACGTLAVSLRGASAVVVFRASAPAVKPHSLRWSEQQCPAAPVSASAKGEKAWSERTS